MGRWEQSSQYSQHTPARPIMLTGSPPPSCMLGGTSIRSLLLRQCSNAVPAHGGAIPFSPQLPPLSPPGHWNPVGSQKGSVSGQNGAANLKGHQSGSQGVANPLPFALWPFSVQHIGYSLSQTPNPQKGPQRSSLHATTPRLPKRNWVGVWMRQTLSLGSTLGEG